MTTPETREYQSGPHAPLDLRRCAPVAAPDHRQSNLTSRHGLIRAQTTKKSAQPCIKQIVRWRCCPDSCSVRPVEFSNASAKVSSHFNGGQSYDLTISAPGIPSGKL